MKRIILAATIVATLTACAWWQKHGSQINCAAIATVENAPALIAIVAACATISSVVTVLPCIEAAAGSQWASDVVACFAADGAGIVSCPAARGGPMRATPANAEAQEKLRAAVQAKYGDSLK